jgi:NADH-quinone oxidoreductase subunit G
MFDGASTAAADVHLPAEGHAEKEGTVTHPDGRLQRVRPSVPRPGAVRPLWQALSELSARLGDDPGAGTASEIFDLLAADIPAYAGISVDDVGGMGLRWQERNGLGAADEVGGEAPTSAREGAGRDPGEGLLLGTRRDLWADWVAERNPALRFLAAGQTLELGAADADRLGLRDGDRAEVRAGERSLVATVGLRERMLAGTALLTEGTASEPAGILAGARRVEVAPAPEPEPERPEPPAAAEDGEPAAPALVVTRREPVSW